MTSRIAAIAVALFLVVATGMARSVSYLCLMHGEQHSTCCCEQPDADAETADCPKLERDDPCCRVQVSEATQAPLMRRDGPQHEPLPLELVAALVPPAIDIPRLPSRDVAPPPDACMPPGGTGPPIFILHCSYLI